MRWKGRIRTKERDVILNEGAREGGKREERGGREGGGGCVSLCVCVRVVMSCRHRMDREGSSFSFS